MPTLHSTKILGDLRVTGITNLNEVGAFTLNGQLTSTVVTGTAPFVIASTTAVANLNADLLDGQHGSYYQNASNINTGTLAIARGGTNITTYAAGDILYASAANVLSRLAKGTDGQVLKLASGLPVWGTDNNTTYGVFTNTLNGLVPTPNETGSTKFLRQDGSWVVPTDTNTWRTVEVNDVSIGSNTLDLRSGTNVTVSDASGVVTFSSPSLSKGTDSGSGFVTDVAVSGHQITLTKSSAVTSVAAGNGMNFTTITGTGSVTMGTPSTLTDATTNGVTATSHTHAITTYAVSGTANQITVSGSPKVLGSATTLSLPQNIHTGATPTFARLSLSQPMTAGTTAAFTNPHLALVPTDNIDNTGFVGMTFATSTTANYGYSLGALRTTNGGGNLVIRNHVADAAGVEAFRLSATGTITLPTSGALTTSTGPLTISTSAGNGDITIDPNGSGRLIHTKQLASKGATYAHTWMQFDEDVNGNALYLGSGALTVLGAGESVSQIRGQIGTTAEALVFGSDEAAASTAFRFIGSLQSGWASRTEVLGITGAGNATLLGDLTTGGDLIVNGGDIKQTAKTGTDQVGGSLIIASGQGTGAGAASTIKFQTPTATTTGTTTQALADRLTITSTGVTISGTLQVDGTTQTINSTTVTLDDPVITLGGDTAPTVDDNKDRGIEYRWHNGTVAKLGFFGYDDSISRFTFIPDATNTSEVFSGTLGDARFNNLELIGGSNIGIFTPTSLSATRTYTFPDATGTVALTSDLHTRSHTMTSTSDHTAGNWKLFHSNGSGQVVELSLGTAGQYLRAGGAAAAPTFAQIAYSEISGTPTIPTGFSISAGATDGIFDITGTGGTNSVSYAVAPYAAKTVGGFDSSAVNPDGTTRLNWNGNFYATNLYSGGNIVYTSANLPTYPTVNDASLTLTTSAGATNTAVTIGTGTGFTANDSTNTTYDIDVGPALTNLATTMTGAGSGFLKKTAQDTYSIDTNTYLTAQSNDFGTVTVSDTDSGHTWAETGSAVADTTGDTLTIVSGTGINVDVSATTDAIRITNSDRGSSQNIFKNFTDGTTTSVADSNNDTFKFRGSGVTVAVQNDDATHGDNLLISWSHPNTSDQGSVDNSNGTVIQDITLDDAGHVTAIGSVDLDPRYITRLSTGTLDVNAANGTQLFIGSTGSWTNRGPAVNNAGALLSINTHSGNYYSQLWFDTAGGSFYHRTANAALPTASWNKVWDAGNDGSGSGLDADKLDNLDSTQFLRSDESDSMTGDLTINGTLFATAKSFLINHPTKENMKLRYGSLEGPENGVYVRGKLKGSNIIELPDYWTGLVDEDSITVNLTPIGAYQKLYVEKIENNKVYIANENLLLHKEINCYFTVFGERKDIEVLKVEIEINN